MTITALPPVRRPVPLRRRLVAAAGSAFAEFFGGRRMAFYASGTASLARAMAECAAHCPSSSPEVIVPAYGCPDLVAACAYASVRPRLVDIVSSAWRYDPDSLKSSISRHTVAIVSVNLLGVGDDADTLRKICDEHRISLIQDSAQHLPRERTEWPGDYIILSFGRGKPLNLLHGGMLIGPRESGTQPPESAPEFPVQARFRASRLAALAFNVLTTPPAYGIISRLPGTGLGEVLYKPLLDGAPLPGHAWGRIDTAFASYRLYPSYSRSVWELALEEWRQLGIEPLLCPSAPPSAEPLRLALLAPDRAARDDLVGRFRANGLGPSRFYGSSMIGLPAIPDGVRQQGPFPNASDLADRLFTLPTHRQVTLETVTHARRIAFRRATREC